MQRLAARLWGGVKFPVPEEPKQEETPVGRPAVAKTTPTAEEMFVSALNRNQLKVYEEVRPQSPFTMEIPVYGRPSGMLWHIQIISPYDDGGGIYCQLIDPFKRGRCFHAVKANNQYQSLNATDPWGAALAFLNQLQANDTWVKDIAG